MLEVVAWGSSTARDFANELIGTSWSGQDLDGSADYVCAGQIAFVAIRWYRPDGFGLPHKVVPCDWRNPGPLRLTDDRRVLA